MKCPMCGGDTLNDLVVKGKKTNEEWMRTATTEELAGAMYEWHTKGYARGKNGLPLNPITEIVVWLKEEH